MNNKLRIGRTLYTNYNGEGWVMVVNLITFHWHDGAPIITPNHFSSNGGSIPKVLWGLLGDGKDGLLGAYLLHDWLYDPKCEVDITRKHADKLLYLYLRELGCCWLKAQTIYAGVRAGGSRSWRVPKDKPLISDFN